MGDEERIYLSDGQVGSSFGSPEGCHVPLNIINVSVASQGNHICYHFFILPWCAGQDVLGKTKSQKSLMKQVQETRPIAYFWGAM